MLSFTFYLLLCQISHFVHSLLPVCLCSSLTFFKRSILNSLTSNKNVYLRSVIRGHQDSSRACMAHFGNLNQARVHNEFPGQVKPPVLLCRLERHMPR